MRQPSRSPHGSLTKGGPAIEPSPSSPSHWAKSYADKDRSICFQKCWPHNARHGGPGAAAQTTLPTLPGTLRASTSGGILDGFLNGICAFPPKTGVDVKRLCRSRRPASRLVIRFGDDARGRQGVISTRDPSSRIRAPVRRAKIRGSEKHDARVEMEARFAPFGCLKPGY
jgi:hypothetical protein